MSIYLLPKTITNEIDKIRRTFFWKGGGTKRKYHLIKWVKVCKSKKKGGVGIKNLTKLNINFLCKWWWRLEQEEGLWQELVKNKYLYKDSIHTVSHKLHDSPIWYDLLKVKGIYLEGRIVKIENGKKTRFWEDSWLFDKPLCSLIPELFILCKKKEVSVYNVKKGNAQLSFQRWLPIELRDIWTKVLSLVEIF
jgi:hypothetical protein